MTETADRRIEDARLLIVDDQEANTQVLERLLRRSGFAHVRSITDPERALAMYSEFHPDLILLDLHMPKLDGFAVMTQLNRQVPSDYYLPILVLTADVNPEAKQRALSLGAKDFLTKPFDRVEVLLRIKNLLETRWLHLQLRGHNQRLEQRVQERTTELEASLEQRRMLLSRLVTVQEEERQRIANDAENRAGGFHLVIRDDGVGFRPEDVAAPLPGHLGLASIRERAQMAGGWGRVESAPGRGTTVEFLVPVAKDSARAWELNAHSGPEPGADGAYPVRVEAAP